MENTLKTKPKNGTRYCPICGHKLRKNRKDRNGSQRRLCAQSRPLCHKKRYMWHYLDFPPGVVPRDTNCLEGGANSSLLKLDPKIWHQEVTA